VLTFLTALDTPPVANAGNDEYIQLPVDTIVLDGSKSTDDVRIINYIWDQTSGDQGGVQVDGEFTPRLTVKNLKEGEYIFNLTVFDENGQADDDDVTIYVKGYTHCFLAHSIHCLVTSLCLS